jgi:type I restriction enzyme S subunit
MNGPTRTKRTNSSNVPWLESIPDHWHVVPSKRLFSEQKERALDGDEQLTASQAHGVIRQSDYVARTGQRVVQIFKNLEQRKHVEPDDFVISMRSFQGGLERAWARGCIRSSYVVLRPSPSAKVGYYAHLFKSDVYVRALQATSHFIRDGQDLNFANFTLVDLPLPPDHEQLAIADFLESKIAAIDELIAKKERLVELLQEKRQAIITEAVTTGFHDSANLRPSKSAWYSSLPRHWVEARVKNVVRQVSDGPHFSPPYVEREDGVMFISARNVRVDEWSLADAKYITRDLYTELCKRITPRRGDVLYTKGGTTGIARAVDFDEPFQVWVHVAVLRLRPARIAPEYLAYALNSTPCYEQAQLHTRGATNQDLGLTRMINIEFPLPLLDEQLAVCAELKRRLEPLDATRRLLGRQLETLGEYRQELITAAVTGKIDVTMLPEAV